MDAAKNYLSHNKDSWNKRTIAHVDSEFYDNKSFIAGRNSLNPIELPFLQEIKGKDVIHLQCHFGQDSISLARMGAHVTAIDLSNEAISEANTLADKCGVDVDFICADVFDTLNHVDKKFDVVFASYGTIGWLPDINKWAQIVSSLLKKGGKLVFAEFHPVVWMYNDELTEVAYNYFKDEAIVETNTATYTDQETPIAQTNVTWNHSLSSVVNALIQQGMTIQTLNEYDYSPYNCLSNMEEFENGKFRVKQFKNYVPLVYLIHAEKA